MENKHFGIFKELKGQKGKKTAHDIHPQIIFGHILVPTTHIPQTFWHDAESAFKINGKHKTC